MAMMNHNDIHNWLN